VVLHALDTSLSIAGGTSVGGNYSGVTHDGNREQGQCGKAQVATIVAMMIETITVMA